MHTSSCCCRRASAIVWLIPIIAFLIASSSHASVLLNDSFADGNRSNTSLPTDSAVWIGQSAGNGSNSVAPGAISFVLPTNSLKVWTYFTSDLSAPDGNQPHNSVTMLGVGDTLTTSMSFRPSGVTATSTSKNFRLGIFFDPTDARVQADVNSDGGGGTAPWTDATGYAVQIPLNSSTTNANPMLIEKRTTSNSSLLGSSGAYAAAPTGGQAYSITSGSDYTLRLTLNVVSASQLDVTSTLLQGVTTISTQTVSDLGTSFGGTAIGAGLLPGSQSIYTKFDQLFFRDSDNTQATGLDITNFKVDLTSVPEPASLFV